MIYFLYKWRSHLIKSFILILLIKNIKFAESSLIWDKVIFNCLPVNPHGLFLLAVSVNVFFFFFMFIYLFGCIRSQLQHSGSSLGHAGSFFVEHELSSCGLQALVAPRDVGSQTKDQTWFPCVAR